MNNVINTIPWPNLMIVFAPVMLVLWVLYKWSLRPLNALYAVTRMLGQLLMVGYFLTYIFLSDNAWIVLMILTVMVFASSWIALGVVSSMRKALYGKALISVALSGSLMLVLVSGGVLELEPWYLPQYVIPLGGMIFASAMNSVSLSAERLQAEIKRDVAYDEARTIALGAALIPVINSLFAVGLVSLPGMMTGQILSGVSPLIAVRYQIMVMCMLLSVSGLSAVCFLLLVKPDFQRLVFLAGTESDAGGDSSDSVLIIPNDEIK